MATKAKLESLIAARGEVEAACTLLAQPTARNLDRCGAVLNSTCQKFARLNLRELQKSAETVAQVQRLQEAVARARAMLGHARDYHDAWTNAWATLSSGYSPHGVVRAPERRGSISLAG